ncbi:MAG: septum formation initiator family protein [Verrucomicrobiae bacterium]|nr:septum formation initiator family protein [Verrucomicrobiae bacterium]
MSVPTIWDRLTHAVIVLIFLAGVTLVIVSYLPLIRQNKAMREELFRIEQKIQEAEKLNRQKKAALEALRNDPQAVERLAREKLGLAKPGEVVVHFQPPITNSSFLMEAPPQK